MQQTNLKKPTFLFFRNHSLFHNFKNKDRKNLLLKPLLILFFLGIVSLSQGQQFTVYNTWDFEEMTVGICDEDTIDKYFDWYDCVYYDQEPLVHIVIDTINEQPTQVFRIKHRPGEVGHGFGMRVWLTDEKDDFDEIYVSYNWKFGENYNSNAGGKIPGIVALPRDPDQGGGACPRSGYGFSAHYMYKQAGSLISYHYDRTPNHSCPWSESRYRFNDIYLNNGCWYTITERLVMNSFTNGVANDDGVKETWVDGRLLFQETGLILMEDEADTMKIDGFRIANFYGGADASYEPLTACYGYLDNIAVWMPADDSISTKDELHHPSTVLPTPVEITDREVYYDSYITTEGTLSNTEYGSTYSRCIDEAFLIDAGEGNSVTYTFSAGQMGKGDYLFFYDGNTTDAEILKMQVSGTLSGTVTSTDRYMFIRFSVDEDTPSTGWTGTISFNEVTTPDTPTNLHVTDSTHTTISIGWTDNADNEARYIIERSLTEYDFVAFDSVYANTNDYLDYNLSVDTTYYYRVRAWNSAGYSSYSNTICARIGPYIPSDKIAQINFRGLGYFQFGWTNLTGDAGSYPADLGNGISLTKTGTLQGGANGEPVSILPLNASQSYCYIEYSDETPVVFTVSGLETNLTYAFDFFTSRNDSTASGDRTTFFTIGPNTVSLNSVGNTDSLLTITDVSPNQSGEVSITMTKLTGGFGYINAMFIRYADVSMLTVPDDPTNLHVTDSTSTSISMAWTDESDNESNFIIERSLSGSEFEVITSVSANTVNYTDTGLSVDTTYYYRVKATNVAGDSEYSNTVCSRLDLTPPPLPDAPTNLHVTDSTDTSISIAWTDESDEEDSFIIERSLTEYGFQVIASVNANVESYTDTGLSVDTTYYYRVKASNTTGDSEYSDTVCSRLATIVQYDTVAMINFMETGYSETDWVNLTGNSGDYPADLGNGVSLSKTGTITGSHNGEPVTILPTNVSTSYCFIEYNDENPVVFTVSGLNTAKTYAFDFFTSRDDETASGDRTTYFTIGGNTVSLNPIGNTDSLLTISGVSPNPSGNVSITMTKLTGIFGYINAMLIRVSGTPTAPDAPSSLVATDSTNTSISIQWVDGSTNENGFVIERSLTSGTGFDSINSVGTNVTTFTDTGLSQETTYYYRVKAYNSYGASGYSDELEAHTDDNSIVISNVALYKTATQSSTYAGGVASRAVDGNTDGSFSNGSVTHTASETNAWWQVDLGDDYQIDSIEVWNRTAYMDRLDNYYVMVADTFTSTSLSTALSESTWSEHRTSYPDTTHYFYPDATGHYVRVQLGDTNSLSLAEVIVWGYDADLKEAILSKEINPGIEPEKPINVYPNPGSTMITISGFDQAIEIKIVDMLGKVIHLEGKVNNSTQIDVSNLKKGMYLIMLKTENNYHLKKFIKN